jgi:hypothetical protein
MANDTFQKTPVNRNVRRRLFRAARLGTRPVPVVPNIGDAVKAVDAVAAYKTGWKLSPDNPAVVVNAAWANRKSY